MSLPVDIFAYYPTLLKCIHVKCLRAINPYRLHYIALAKDPNLSALDLLYLTLTV